MPSKAVVIRRSPGRSWHVYIIWIALVAAIVPGCAQLQQLQHPRDRQVESFLGLRFGDSLSRAESVFPLGIREISPYGADAYRVEHVRAGQVEYEAIVFEFPEGDGMQLAEASFASRYSGAILADLERGLGQPTLSDPSPQGEEQLWRTGSGFRVTFNAQADHLIMIGPKGEPLVQDVELRSKKGN